jgi:two-component system copper resistance phosphate regulon response regulator CusR
MLTMSAGMRLLIVEDEPVAAALLAKGLREHAYAVDVANDGGAALERAALNPYDLIILDVLLPGMDGLEVCRRLRGRDVTAPVLMLTARGGIDERVQGLDAGADDYLPKPFHFPELLARVRALLRRGPALAPSVVRVADLCIDTRTRHVERGGQPVQLTAKEYALLAYLARREGEIVTRADIIERVWDDHFDPMSNVIEVHIQRLRRKVDDPHDRKLIHTRRGAGYVLMPGSADGSA